ncbi:MAG TPA: PP2C family serine/threonine-protein phosphatase [Acidiferrobacterales bacterium]
MKFQLAHHSLKGARPTNQDRIAYAETDSALLMVLADGLGGHEGGELAAEALTQTLVRAFQSVKQPYITKPSAFLALGIMQAHKQILAHGRAQIPPITPRTTCVVCLVQRGYAYWAHVGDSRLYHFRGTELLARTLDHSTTEQLRQDGLLSEEEMQQHPDKGHLLKCVGGPRKPVISLGEETVLHRGDSLLLCSDGLWQAFTPDEIARYLAYKSLDEGTEEMLLAAESKMKRTCDNLSAIALRWNEPVTSELPLQSAPAKDADPDALWEAARVQTQGRKLQDKEHKTTPRTHKEELEDTIKELEEFVKQFEPKR